MPLMKQRRSGFHQGVSSSCRPDTYIILGLKMARSSTKNQVSDPLRTPTSRNSCNPAPPRVRSPVAKCWSVPTQHRPAADWGRSGHPITGIARCRACGARDQADGAPAEKGDELAPLRVLPPRLKPHSVGRETRRGDRASHLSQALGDGRSWHLTDLAGLADDVRCSGQTGSGWQRVKSALLTQPV
jgi:hypothetical protein